MPKGNGSPKFTKEQVKASMLLLQEKRLEKQKVNKQKVEVMEDIERVLDIKFIKIQSNWNKGIKNNPQKVEIIKNIFS